MGPVPSSGTYLTLLCFARFMPSNRLNNQSIKIREFIITCYHSFLGGYKGVVVPTPQSAHQNFHSPLQTLPETCPGRTAGFAQTGSGQTVGSAQTVAVERTVGSGGRQAGVGAGWRGRSGRRRSAGFGRGPGRCRRSRRRCRLIGGLRPYGSGSCGRMLSWLNVDLYRV